MTESLVKEYYTASVRKEWRRLVRDPYHRLEFDTTLHYLEKYLPKTGLILDAGGGPGRYTVELAGRGYDMILLDVTPANLAFAKRRIRKFKLKPQVRNVIEGSIVDLSRIEDNTFDAVICLGGPLSHIVDAEKRDKAIRELVRVARPGAPVCVSVMSRLSLLVIELILFQEEIGMPHFKQIRDTGSYDGAHGFTACHFYLPEELREAFKDKGVTIHEMVGLEGISSNHRRKLNQLAKDESLYKIWLETHYQTCTHPAIVGTSEHMLIVTTKK